TETLLEACSSVNVGSDEVTFTDTILPSQNDSNTLSLSGTLIYQDNSNKDATDFSVVGPCSEDVSEPTLLSVVTTSCTGKASNDFDTGYVQFTTDNVDVTYTATLASIRGSADAAFEVYDQDGNTVTECDETDQGTETCTLDLLANSTYAIELHVFDEVSDYSFTMTQ
ncbi:MAG: hypothetical protein COA99_05645, partial [Moraxellaceae bacterium]